MQSRFKMQRRFKIVDEFNQIIDKACKDRPIKDFLEEATDFNHQELDLHQTTRLYDEYRDECDDWIKFFVTNSGLTPLEFLSFCNFDYIWDTENYRFAIEDTEKNKFFVVEAMFKCYCIELLDVLDL